MGDLKLLGEPEASLIDCSSDSSSAFRDLLISVL